MNNWAKVKEWVNENAPMLSVLYDNKYVGMIYDRFASLPPKNQKQMILGGLLGIVFLVICYMFVSYLGLWSTSDHAATSEAMINMLQQYQKDHRDKASQIQNLERNNQLAAAGQFKEQLMNDARNSGISPRLVTIEEKGDDAGDDAPKASHDVKMRRATISLQRVNLSQLKTFLSSIEFGAFNLSISSLKISNDDKIRGYMNVDMGVVAYLFQGEEGGS